MIANTVHWVQYNGIQLNLSRIESFDSEAVYDPVDIDRVFNLVTLRVVGIINAQINTGNLSNAQVLEYYRAALLEPRKQLVVAINGQNTIINPGVDSDNGPHPVRVRVYGFQGVTIMVEFEVEYREPACAESEVIVTSNRWEQQTDIDADGYTTLTSHGLLVIDSSKTEDNPDFYRQIPFPVAFQTPGFVRLSQNFKVSADGNKLNWTIVDKEVYVVPPQDVDTNNNLQKITRWEGVWTQEGSFDNGGGLAVLGTLAMKAWGQRTCNKSTLVQFCLDVFQSKIANQRWVIESYKFDEGLSENFVALTVNVYTVALNGVALIDIPVPDNMGAPLIIYRASGATRISSRGTAGLWIVVKDVVASCDSKTTTTVVTSGTNENDPPEFTGSNPPTSAADPIQQVRNDVNQDENLYIKNDIATQVVECRNTLQLARASGEEDAEAFFAEIGAPITKKIVRFDMQRLNKLPDIPKPTLEGEVVLRKTITMQESLLLPSGVDRLYSVQGEYIFGYRQPTDIATDSTTLIVPKAVTDTQSISELPNNTLTASSFVEGLIG
jgi:hypothetical protein